MLKRVYRTMATVAALSALVMVSQAGAADKLVVKGTDGVAEVFKVKDAGRTFALAALSLSDTTTDPETGFPINQSPVLGVYNSSVIRMNVKPTGITEWRLNSGAAESGAIKYSTPGGGIGITLFTGATYDQNRFDIGNYGSVAGLGYGAKGFWVLQSSGYAGVGVTSPSAALDIAGDTIRLRNSKIGTGNCSGGEITWDADFIYVCVSANTWKKAALQ